MKRMKKMKKIKDWVVYLLRCGDGTLYCGITNDLDARLITHNRGRGARYTRGRLPVSLIYSSRRMGRGDALRLEVVVKRLPRARKIKAILGF